MYIPKCLYHVHVNVFCGLSWKVDSDWDAVKYFLCFK